MENWVYQVRIWFQLHKVLGSDQVLFFKGSFQMWKQEISQESISKWWWAPKKSRGTE